MRSSLHAPSAGASVSESPPRTRVKHIDLLERQSRSQWLPRAVVVGDPRIDPNGDRLLRQRQECDRVGAELLEVLHRTLELELPARQRSVSRSPEVLGAETDLHLAARLDRSTPRVVTEIEHKL